MQKWQGFIQNPERKGSLKNPKWLHVEPKMILQSPFERFLFLKNLTGFQNTGQENFLINTFFV